MKLGDPVPAYCSCGPTWVFIGYRRLPCGKCGEHMTLQPQVRWTGEDDNLQAMAIERETQ